VGENKNCALCHTDGDLTAYSCDMCHSASVMAGVHEPRGITTIEGLCVLCHPTGQVP
jgi:hypothetical protein